MPFITTLKIKRTNIPKTGFPYNLPAIKLLKQLNFNPAVTFFSGENGAGKSTLLEAIAVAMRLNHEGGSRNFNFSTAEKEPEFHKDILITRSAKPIKDSYFYRSESFYNVITNINRIDPGLKDAYGGKDLHTRSHGEALLDLMTHRFGSSGLYILDEPETALSVQNQLAFLIRMNELVNRGSQFIIATHSPLLITYPNSKIYQFSDKGVEKINYGESDNFTLMRSFLNSPEIFLKELFTCHNDA